MTESNDRIDIKSLTPEELSLLFKELGQPSYRAGQVFSRFASGCGSWDELTSLPKALRSRLDGMCRLYPPNPYGNLSRGLTERLNSFGGFSTATPWRPWSCATVTATPCASRLR